MLKKYAKPYELVVAITMYVLEHIKNSCKKMQLKLIFRHFSGEKKGEYNNSKFVQLLQIEKVSKKKGFFDFTKLKVNYLIRNQK